MALRLLRLPLARLCRVPTWVGTRHSFSISQPPEKAKITALTKQLVTKMCETKDVDFSKVPHAEVRTIMSLMNTRTMSRQKDIEYLNKWQEDRKADGPFFQLMENHTNQQLRVLASSGGKIISQIQMQTQTKIILFFDLGIILICAKTSKNAVEAQAAILKSFKQTGDVFDCSDFASPSRIARVIRQGEFKAIATATNTHINFIGGSKVMIKGKSPEDIYIAFQSLKRALTQAKQGTHIQAFAAFPRSRDRFEFPISLVPFVLIDDFAVDLKDPKERKYTLASPEPSLQWKYIPQFEGEPFQQVDYKLISDERKRLDEIEESDEKTVHAFLLRPMRDAFEKAMRSVNRVGLAINLKSVFGVGYLTRRSLGKTLIFDSNVYLTDDAVSLSDLRSKWIADANHADFEPRIPTSSINHLRKQLRESYERTLKIEAGESPPTERVEQTILKVKSMQNKTIAYLTLIGTPNMTTQLRSHRFINATLQLNHNRWKEPPFEIEYKFNQNNVPFKGGASTVNYKIARLTQQLQPVDVQSIIMHVAAQEQAPCDYQMLFSSESELTYGREDIAQYINDNIQYMPSENNSVELLQHKVNFHLDIKGEYMAEAIESNPIQPRYILDSLAQQQQSGVKEDSDSDEDDMKQPMPLPGTVWPGSYQLRKHIVEHIEAYEINREITVEVVNQYSTDWPINLKNFRDASTCSTQFVRMVYQPDPLDVSQPGVWNRFVSVSQWIAHQLTLPKQKSIMPS